MKTLAELKREMPAQVVCRECKTEFATGGSDTMEHHCEGNDTGPRQLGCGWVFLCPSCTGPLPSPIDILGMTVWLRDNRHRLHNKNCSQERSFQIG